jgi:uncharacterized protein YndB with AHSA1/START domain
MENQRLSMSVDVTINAPVSKVWKTATDKGDIKKYFFGTDVNTDWKVGNPIVFSGEYEGKSYVEKGVVLGFDKENELSYSYLASGWEDKPENYNKITYQLKDEGNGHTKLTISQSNIPDQNTYDHCVENWKQVAEGLKKVAEA